MRDGPTMVASPHPGPLGEPTYGISERDRRILARARQKLSKDGAIDWEEALRALREATEELIPNGRIFLLGPRMQRNALSAITPPDVLTPLVGSLISGVGIVQRNQAPQVDAGLYVARLARDGRLRVLTRFDLASDG